MVCAGEGSNVAAYRLIDVCLNELFQARVARES